MVEPKLPKKPKLDNATTEDLTEVKPLMEKERRSMETANEKIEKELTVLISLDKRITDNNLQGWLPPTCVNKLKAMIVRLQQAQTTIKLLTEKNEAAGQTKIDLKNEVSAALPEAVRLKKADTQLIDLAEEEKKQWRVSSQFVLAWVSRQPGRAVWITRWAVCG